MEVKGRLWDSRRLGQSSGTYPLRLLARDLCSFWLAPPPSPAGSQGLGPSRKGARERSRRGGQGRKQQRKLGVVLVSSSTPASLLGGRGWTRCPGGGEGKPVPLGGSGAWAPEALGEGQVNTLAPRWRGQSPFLLLCSTVQVPIQEWELWPKPQ